MSLTTKQKIAQKEKELANLKAMDRKEETGQKIIIGGLMLKLARKDAQTAQRLIQTIEKNVDRKVDLKRLAPLLAELKKQVDYQPSNNTLNQ